MKIEIEKKKQGFRRDRRHKFASLSPRIHRRQTETFKCVIRSFVTLFISRNGPPTKDIEALLPVRGPGDELRD